MNAPLGISPLPTHKDRRGWLIAFGVLEILIACFFLLMALLMVALIPNMPKPPGQPQIPSAMFYGIGAFYGALGAIFAAGGIGSIQAKSWARVLMIVLSSLWLGFGLLGTLGVAAMMPLMMRQQEAILQQNPAAQGGQLPPHFMGTVMVVTIAFQVVIMVLLPLVILIFYTRKNVKATCEALSNPPSPLLPATAVPAAPTAVASPTIPGAPATDSTKRGLPVPIVLAVMWFSFVAVSGARNSVVVSAGDRLWREGSRG